MTGSAHVPGLDGGTWGGQRIEVDEDRAVVLLRDTNADEGSAGGSVVLVLDSNTGELLHRIDPPDGVTYTAALPIGDDELLIADQRYRWTVIDAERRIVDGPRVLGLDRRSPPSTEKRVGTSPPTGTATCTSSIPLGSACGQVLHVAE